jgi:hypothetical protein
MNNPTHIYCSACGAALDAEINREHIFCKYCGSKNRLEHEAIRTNINVGNINITTKTDLNNLISSAKYFAGIRQFDKANEVLTAVIISGCEDYRVYICKARIDLQTNDTHSLLYSIEKLKTLEVMQQSSEITQAIRELVAYKEPKGFTALHIVSLFQRYDLVVFCVEHGSDVNAVAKYGWCVSCSVATPCAKHGEIDVGHTTEGSVTPINIMFTSAIKPKFNAKFNENKEQVNTIRKYLMQQGAKDRFRLRIC